MHTGSVQIRFGNPQLDHITRYTTNVLLDKSQLLAGFSSVPEGDILTKFRMLVSTWERAEALTSTQHNWSDLS